MFDFLRWNLLKLDAAPGTLIYAGEERSFKPSIRHWAYNAETLDEHLEQGTSFRPDSGRMNLLVVTGVHEPELIKQLAVGLDLPPLYVEDVLNTGQRPIMAWADENTGFVVMRHVMVVDGRVVNEQVSMLWREGLVVVFLERESGLLDGVLSRLRQGRGRIRKADATYMMAAILDALVDSHTLALVTIGDLAQDLENRLMNALSDEMLGELYELKREIILARNALMPEREIFKALMRDDAEIPDDVMPFIQDTAGHHEQTLEGVISLHDILKSMIDFQISLISIRTNKVMQLLTVTATIFIPLTFIAGVYGMNFQNMPELSWRYGYHAVMVLMGVVGVGMFLYFKRKKYL
ncbi:magnesium/cobalt transporter CorA [Pseudodesulfovibrio sp.]|uniref:magnesium/cobalt transporter CorA n=1 Tax=unclassified Pseudodesulfovibrio TaxID=2661612 RepID=UPI003B003F2F